VSARPTRATLTRRELLELAAGAALAARLAPRTTSAEPAGFFDEAELATVEALSELVIPADDHSPGARAAGVAPFLDAFLAATDAAYPDEAKLRDAWRTGLTTARAACRELHGRDVPACDEAEQTALLTRLASKERAGTPEGAFFALLKEWTVDLYYTTEIGVKQELGYLGNSVLDEFVGELPDRPAREER